MLGVVWICQSRCWMVVSNIILQPRFRILTSRAAEGEGVSSGLEKATKSKLGNWRGKLPAAFVCVFPRYQLIPYSSPKSFHFVCSFQFISISRAALTEHKETGSDFRLSWVQIIGYTDLYIQPLSANFILSFRFQLFHWWNLDYLLSFLSLTIWMYYTRKILHFWRNKVTLNAFLLFREIL